MIKTEVLDLSCSRKSIEFDFDWFLDSLDIWVLILLRRWILKQLHQQLILKRFSLTLLYILLNWHYDYVLNSNIIINKHWLIRSSSTTVCWISSNGTVHSSLIFSITRRHILSKIILFVKSGVYFEVPFMRGSAWTHFLAHSLTLWCPSQSFWYSGVPCKSGSQWRNIVSIVPLSSSRSPYPWI